jgi:hypothetical protein
MGNSGEKEHCLAQWLVPPEGRERQPIAIQLATFYAPVVRLPWFRRLFSREPPLRSIEIVPVVGVSLGSAFRQSDADARAIRVEHRVVSREAIEARLKARGLRHERGGSRELRVEGQQSKRAVVLRFADPASVSIATTRLSYRDDWPTAITVAYALMEVLGPLVARMPPSELLIDPQRSVAQLCSDYRAALDESIERGMNALNEAGALTRQVSQELSKAQPRPVKKQDSGPES